jgi:hypothetical protein
VKKGTRLTPSKGVAIIIAFSLIVFSCINVVMQGESDISGVKYDLEIPPVFPEAWKKAEKTICNLAHDTVASVRQSIENLKNHRLP